MRITRSTSVNVVAGVVSSDGLYLVTRRPDRKAYGGCLEFPGGKRELGETDMEALTREFNEELGIQITAATLMMDTVSGNDGEIVVRVFRVTEWNGVPIPREGQSIHWMTSGDISNSVLTPATRAAAAEL